MLLTIIPSDSAVSVDHVSASGLSLTNIPSNIHALQWQGDAGWIEFNDNKPNEAIKELPQWAFEAHTVFTDQHKKDKIQAITEEEINAYYIMVNAIEDTYPEANMDAVEKLLDMRFKNITTFPRIRKSDRSIIGVDISSLVGDNNTGSIGMLSVRRLVEVGKSLGIPIISDSTPTGVDLVKFESLVQSFGFTTISSPVALYAHVPWTLEMAKTSKKLLIEKERDVIFNGGFTWNGIVFDSNDVARENILSVLSMIAAGVDLPPDFVWRTKNNDNVLLNGSDFIELSSELNKARLTAYQVSWTRKTNLIKAITYEEVKAT